MPYLHPIQERLLEFGAAVVISVDRLPPKPKWRNFANQLNRCGTSPAARFAESRSAESPRDFVHKLQGCLKELRETDVWLRMAEKVQKGVFAPALLAECDELTAILVSSVVTAKKRLPPKDDDQNEQ